MQLYSHTNPHQKTVGEITASLNRLTFLSAAALQFTTQHKDKSVALNLLLCLPSLVAFPIAFLTPSFPPCILCGQGESIDKFQTP